MLELEWGLNNQGGNSEQERTYQREGFPSSTFWGPPSQSLQNSRTTCTVIYLMFIFKASFPFYLKKFSLKGDFYYCHKQKISITCHK